MIWTIKKKMQPTRIFWLSSEKPVKDTIKLAGQDIFIDTTFEPEWHVNQEAYVYEVPLIPEYKNHSILKGEKAIVHHNIPTFKDRRIDYIEDKHVFWCHQTEIFCTISEDGEIKMQQPWILVKSMKKPKPQSNLIILLDEDEDWEQHGIITHVNQSSDELGLEVGQHIYFSKNSDYSIEIEGDTYYRMRNEDIQLIFHDE